MATLTGILILKTVLAKANNSYSRKLQSIWNKTNSRFEPYFISFNPAIVFNFLMNFVFNSNHWIADGVALLTKWLFCSSFYNFLFGDAATPSPHNSKPWLRRSYFPDSRFQISNQSQKLFNCVKWLAAYFHTLGIFCSCKLLTYFFLISRITIMVTYQKKEETNLFAIINSL